MIEERLFGKLTDGRQVKIFELKTSNGTSICVTEYGAAIVSIKTLDKNGVFADVVLGFSDVSGYETQNGTYFGATIGRCANRLHNGKFMLNGTPVILNCNDGKNHLHGGKIGFDQKLWHGEIAGDSVTFTYKSMDGEENYPGNLDVKITYSLSESNVLSVDYFAVSDKDTVINLTNHSYFNLAGHDTGNADNQVLRINAERFTCINDELCPDGTVASVECTPMDFRNFERIKSRIDFDYIQLRNGNGYDHNWVLNKRERGILSLAAELYDEESGRYMAIHTTKPGIQFYSGNFLNATITGKDGAVYTRRSGICLEPQYFPNSMELSYFPSPILKAGEPYHHITRYTFAVKELKLNV